LIGLMVLGSLLIPFNPVQATMAPKPLVFGEADQFGYTWSDSEPYAWIDATSGQEAGFDVVDDAFIGPIDLGFDFKFYEHSYSQIYISTNGLLSFGAGSTAHENRAIPLTSNPDNIIAPFWDDLSLIESDTITSTIHYLSGESQGSSYFVVAWHQVTRSGNITDPLTFEAVLYENGDICFQYQDMQGELDEATVGIEDGDGVIGSQYLYNSAGIKALEGVHSLCFFRPEPAARVKASPAYQSAFTQDYQADFRITIHNTGEVGEDTLNLSTTSDGLLWDLSLFHQDGLTPLSDTDGDGSVDTGAIPQGLASEILVRVQAPPGAKSGDYTLVTLTASSSRNPAQQFEVQMQAAIAAPFVQIFSDSQTGGMYLEAVRAKRQGTYQIVDDFTGSTLAIAGSQVGVYMYAWERND